MWHIFVRFSEMTGTVYLYGAERNQECRVLIYFVLLQKFQNQTQYHKNKEKKPIYFDREDYTIVKTDNPKPACPLKKTNPVSK